MFYFNRKFKIIQKYAPVNFPLYGILSACCGHDFHLPMKISVHGKQMGGQHHSIDTILEGVGLEFRGKVYTTTLSLAALSNARSAF